MSNSTKDVVSIFVRYLQKHPELLDKKSEDIQKIILAKAFNIDTQYSGRTEVSGKRIVGDISIFEGGTAEDWEIMYQSVMDPKYKKGTRNFSTVIKGRPSPLDEAPIFMVPRVRGGPSYLETPLEGVNNEDVQFCPISKGYPMQDVSSFTLGPVVGEGLNVVNAAFSKCITIAHIEGGGVVDFSRKNFWKRARKSHRNIKQVSANSMTVNGKKYNIHEWLKDNEDVWLSEWDLWRKSIAVCSMGDFHWADEDKMDSTLAYRYKQYYLDFVTWKKECYIKVAQKLIVETKVFVFLDRVWRKKGIALSLVHPKAVLLTAEKPITREEIKSLFNSETEMCCLPYIVASCLMGVKVD